VTARLVIAALFVIALLGSPALAQDVGVSGAGVLSIQPIDDWFGGPPYLDFGIGGLAPGVAAGVDVIAKNGFAVIGEFSTAWYQQDQEGRLVDTRRDRFRTTGLSDTKLRDSLFSALAGYATPGRHRFVIAGGVSYVHTALTEDGTPLKDLIFEYEEPAHIALTGGAEYRVTVSPRVAVLIGGRFTFIDRSDGAKDLGAGRHIYRIHGGVRFRLSN
jgi:hypothetical protein